MRWAWSLASAPCGLLENHLERARIDFGKHVALVHELPFLKIHGDELTIHASVHGDGVECGDRAQPGEINGQISLLRGGHHDGYERGSACRAASAFAAAGGSVGTATRIIGLRFGMRAAVVPNPDGHDDEHQQPDPPATFRGRFSDVV